ILTYEKIFGLHRFDLTGLYAARSKYWQQSEAIGEVLRIDVLVCGGLGTSSTHKAYSRADLYRSISQMGRLNYSYDSRYMLTFTVRRDGASVFGDNHKYGVFPSAAAAWNIHNERFMESARSVVDNLKLRVS